MALGGGFAALCYRGKCMQRVKSLGGVKLALGGGFAALC